LGGRVVGAVRRKERMMNHTRAKSPEEIDDPIRVVTMDFDGQKCTWDNVKGLSEELELWWDEGEDGEVTIIFSTMSEAAYKALPEFMGW